MLPSSSALATSARLSRRETLFIALAGMAVSLMIGLLAFAQAGIWRPLDRALLDELIRATASGETARRTVAVDIGDSSLSAVGQWPWPRYRIGSLIQQISARSTLDDARFIVFDPHRHLLELPYRLLQRLR